MKRLFIFSAFLLAVMVGLLFLPAPTETPTTDTPVPTYTRYPEADRIFTELGITNIAQIQVIISDDTPCVETSTTRACALSYTDRVTIYLMTPWLNADPYRRRSTLAHEYLHWQWQKGDRASQADLDAIYPLLRGRMQFYENLGIGTPAFLNEVNSIACTEVADYKLPPTLRQYCASHIPNRNLLPSYY